MNKKKKIVKAKQNLSERKANDEHEMVLSHKAAVAASPDDNAVCGEEDPGAGLESLVSDDHK